MLFNIDKKTYFYRITDILKGKGAFKNGKFQGKAGDLSGISKCKKLIEDYFINIP